MICVGVRPVIRNNILNVTFYVMSSNDDAGLAAGIVAATCVIVYALICFHYIANYWTTMETFPSFTSTNYYFQEDGSLSKTRPVDTTNDYTAYIHDPSNPVPSNGNHILVVAEYSDTFMDQVALICLYRVVHWIKLNKTRVMMWLPSLHLLWILSSL